MSQPKPFWMASAAKVKSYSQGEKPSGYGVFAWNAYSYPVDKAVKLYKSLSSAEKWAEHLNNTAPCDRGYVVRSIYN